MARKRQFRSQLLEIVNFAVEHDGNRAVFVKHGLLTVSDIDNRKTPVPKPAAGAQIEPFTVGATMGDCVAHALKQRAIDRRGARQVKDPDNAAHLFTCRSLMAPTAYYYMRWGLDRLVWVRRPLSRSRQKSVA